MSFSSEKSTPTRKQLELAAKAAGVELEEIDGVLKRWVNSDTFGGMWIIWNPVTDKSDSFDLMVACVNTLEDWVTTSGDLFVKAESYKPDVGGAACIKDYNNDKGLATCAAVFLCAVEIGKSLANGRAM